jgi:hypothetical protein
MSLRITDASGLAGCSPAVRKQLEDALGGLEVMHKAMEEAGIERPKRKQARPEQDAGAALVEWIQTVTLPNGLKPWDFFYHVPNGGFRSAIEAKIFYGQGVRAGWPDYGLDLPLGRFHGMRLELKGPEGDKPTTDQLDFLQRLEGVGYYCRVAWGFEEARDAFEHYLAFAR